MASAGKHRLRELSPPTPAPSPIPRVHAADAVETSDAGTEDMDTAAEVASLRQQINALPPAKRHALLAVLLADTPSLALSPLLPLIQPRLQRDFLRTLPLELALHVLSFVDEPRTLVRAAGVSKFWRGLLEDESTWRHMCWKSGFVVPEPQLANGDLGGVDASATPVATRNMRDLEIGPREYRDEEEERYTPAGRERRGTWDRQALLHEFAAHAHGAGRTGLGIEQATANYGMAGSSTDAYSLTALGRNLPPASYSTASSGSSSGPTRAPASLGLNDSQAPTLSLASTDPSHDYVQRPITLSPTALRGFREAFGLAAGDTTDEPARSPRLARLTTTQMVRDLSASRRPRARPVPVADARGGSSSQTIPDADELFQQSPSSLDGQESRSTRTDSSSSTFSYKSHFKYAFQTEQSWVRGPGRLLSTQMSADSGVVTSLAFDGEWIIVGMETSSIHVFEGASGAYVRTLDGHQTGVWCLGLVSKGGGPRPRARNQQTWAEEAVDGASEPSRRTGKERAPRQPSASAETAHSAFFRPDATPLASSSYTSPGSPPISSSQPSRPRRPRPAHRRHSSYSGSSPRAAESFVSAASDADAAGGMGIGAGGPTGDSLLQGSACATARGWGQDGAVLVSGGCDRTVRVWDVSTGRCIHTLTGHASTVRCLRVLDARPIAVSGSRDGTVRVWDIDNGEPIHVLNGHASSVRAIDVRGNKAVSGSYDATCRLWNVDTGECLHVFRGHFSKIYSVAFDGTRIVSGSLDSTVRVWSAQDGTLIALLQGHTTLVGQLQLDPRTNTLITGGSDGRVLVFSLKTYEMLHQLEAHSTSVNCLQFDERFVVTGGNDGRIKLWDFRTGAYIRDLCEPSLGIWRVVIRDDKVVTLSRREELAPTPEDPNRRVEKTMMDVRTFRPSPDDTTTPSEAASPSWDGYPLA